MLKYFFKKLATRFNSENALSDVTWAMAEQFDEFFVAFLEFFEFPTDLKEARTITREYLLSSECRPDFMINSGAQTIIIENKIYDTNYHLKEYKRLINAFGLIVNHRINNESLQEARNLDIKVKTWGEFVSFLTKYNFPEDIEQYVRAYIEYVKEVCSIMEITEIRFNNLHSLTVFYNLAGIIINKYHNTRVDVKLYSAPSRSCSSTHTGQYFELNKIDSTDKVWPLLGVWYGDVNHCICVWFEKDWCSKIYQFYKGQNITKNMYTIGTENSGAVAFELKYEIYNEFNKANTERQYQILSEYLSEVIEEIITHL